VFESLVLYQTFLVAVTLDINTDSGKKKVCKLLNKFCCSLNEQSMYKYMFKLVLLVLSQIKYLTLKCTRVEIKLTCKHSSKAR